MAREGRKGVNLGMIIPEIDLIKLSRVVYTVSEVKESSYHWSFYA